jgi:hypothetical protein
MEDSYELAVTEEDIEKYLNYCRVFTELGEIKSYRRFSGAQFICENTICE